MKKHILFLLFIIINYPVLAQTEVSLTGILKDSLGTNITQLSTIMVVNKKDMTKVCGGEFEKGTFKLSYSKQTDAEYLLYVFSLGYKDKYIDITHKSGNIGTVKLSLLSQALKEVIVKADRLQHDIVNGDDVFKISGSVLSSEYSLKTMLGRLPGLYVEGKKVSIIGTGTPIFTINGLTPRPGELQMITPDQVEKVVVNRAPSAKYSQSVVGVIDIRLKKKLKDYINARIGNELEFNDVNLDETPSISVNTQSGKFTGYLRYEYTYHKNQVNIPTLSDTYLADEIITKNEEEEEKHKTLHHTLTVSPKYQITDRSFVDVQYNLSFNDTHSFITTNTTRKNNLGTLNELLDGKSTAKKNSFNHNLAARYNYNFSDNSNFLLNFGYSTNKNDKRQDIEENINDVNSLTGLDTRYRSHVYSASAEYNTLLGKKVDLNIGIDYSYIHYNNSNLYDTDTEYTNSYESLNNDHTGAAYLNLKQGFKKFSYSLGIRGEYNERKDKYNEENNFHHFNMMPVAILNYQFSKKVNMQLQYRNFVNNPSLGALNPSITYINKYLYVAGNPNLKSSNTHSLSYRLALPHFISFNASYGYTHNDTRQVTMSDENNPQISKLTYVNINATDVSAHMSYSMLKGIYMFMISGGYSQVFFKIPYLGEENSISKPAFNLFMQHAIHLKNRLFLSVSGNYASRRENATGGSENSYNTSFTCTYPYKNFRFSFDTMFIYNHPKSWSRYGNFYEERHQNLHEKTIQIGIAYIFNKYRNIFSKNRVNDASLRRAQ